MPLAEPDEVDRMRLFITRLTALILAVPLGVALLGTTAARAQFGGTMPPTGIDQAARRGAGQRKAPEAPPPVIPGTKPAFEAAEPSPAVASMTPTEALFDAINRGDLPAARDAVNRGADLNGHNILGMTPTELSVDLGRNNITFMLLSERGEEPGPMRPPGGATVFGRAAAPRPAGGRRPSAVVRTSDEAEELPVVGTTGGTPRLFSGDGGAPIPAAGFLGFDNRR
jgi:hypothetical protein